MLTFAVDLHDWLHFIIEFKVESWILWPSEFDSISFFPSIFFSLLPKMAGFPLFHGRCALLELWGEGTTPFEFSQLLAYRSGDLELVTKHLDELENENLRNLISSMISRNPADRKSAEVYLDEQRGK